jgi:hypothetical protein
MNHLVQWNLRQEYDKMERTTSNPMPLKQEIKYKREIKREKKKERRN